MSNQGQSLGGRLPLLKTDGFDHDQKKLQATLTGKIVPWANEAGFRAATADGEVIGPFNSMLYSPKTGAALMALTGSEAENTALSKRVREVVILTVGAAWGAAYEIYAPTVVGKRKGCWRR